MKPESRLLAYALAAFALALTLTACKPEGPVQKAGRQADNAFEKAGDPFDRAADKFRK